MSVSVNTALGPMTLRARADLSALIEDKSKMIEERRQFFRKTAMALAHGSASPVPCPVCLSTTADCLFVCGHMMCIACVVQLVNAARDTALEEYGNENGDVVCPTCRCELDKDSIFWVTGARPRMYGKAQKLHALLAKCATARENAVVVAESPQLLRHIMPQMQATGITACLMLSGARGKQPTKMVEWLAAAASGLKGKGRVLFVDLAALRGVKLPAVTHVVVLHSLSPSTKLAFETDYLPSFVPTPTVTALPTGTGSSSMHVHVHYLVANDTSEVAVAAVPEGASAHAHAHAHAQ